LEHTKNNLPRESTRPQLVLTALDSAGSAV